MACRMKCREKTFFHAIFILSWLITRCTVINSRTRRIMTMPISSVVLLLLLLNYNYFMAIIFRFKPERNNQRRPLARMKWGGTAPSGGEGRWGGSNMAGDLFSCSSVSPGGSLTPMSSAGGEAGMVMSAYFGQFNQRSSSQFQQRLPLESESRVSSMTIADISPRIAVKKVGQLSTWS